MEASRLQLEILPQPDLTTCGPTCIHAVYRYYGLDISLPDVITAIPMLEEGGTLAVVLACDALRRGFQAVIYTFNLQLFDPSWFNGPPVDLAAKLRAQRQVKENPKLRAATDYYLEFLERGGELRMQDLTSDLLRRHLRRSTPILTGLRATYLYQEKREVDTGVEDDITGLPTGHFVVLCGYDKANKEALVADPLLPNPMAPAQLYHVSMDRLRCAILLGIMTYDANLLVVTQPGKEHKGPDRGNSHRRG